MFSSDLSISLSSPSISPSSYTTADQTLPISFIGPSAGGDGSGSDAGQCHGFWYSFFLIVPSLLFVAYLAFNAKKNFKKLSQGRWHVMVAYYSLLWFATLLNLFWCFRQVILISSCVQFSSEFLKVQILFLSIVYFPLICWYTGWKLSCEYKKWSCAIDNF